ncbi:hypothetical protein [Hymenobacter arizonensis]|uniref:Uncharacterized protein n=1 Tax=Hymenobacter arizonensis TaxID=1227077 RepID=A0A1I6BMT1_HYMAR|nr:hypothetical protein [Hymenobacter arizonensis]SFQ82242.1 hypothetical protein SAMN04515668_4769 [Hymenobacter arizonensis]
MSNPYYYLHYVAKRFFRKLNRFTYADFSDENATVLLSFVGICALHLLVLQPFFADSRPCGLCNPDGRAVALGTTLIAVLGFNFLLFHAKSKAIEQHYKTSRSFFLLPGALFYLFALAFILYRIAA